MLSGFLGHNSTTNSDNRPRKRAGICLTDQPVEKVRLMTNLTPFGNPDGARSSLSEMLSDFVTFDMSIFGDGIGIKQNDLSVRVIVGSKGSGKTVYLRRLQDAASNNESIYADIIQQELPSTTNIVKFSQCFSPNLLTEMWQKLWYCAILRSLVSYLLHDAYLKEFVPGEYSSKLKSYVPKFFNFDTPVSIYSQVTHIINSLNTDHQYKKYFDDDRWPGIEYLIVQALRQAPPVYFFVDSIDEEYAHAPMFWLRCQKGLFYRTMRFLRDARLGGRLHIVICIRDHILASVYRSEHQQRYRGEPHIRILDWSYQAIKYFLEKKIERLDEIYLMQPEKLKRSPVLAWLGHDSIENVHRGIKEPLIQYLIRHTRLAPRDIIHLGNVLSRESIQAKSSGMHAIPPETIRDRISEAAREFGNEQIAICANQVSSSGMPTSSGRFEFAEVYTGDSEYVRGVDEQIKNCICMIGKDRFSDRDLRAAHEHSLEIFGPASDVFSVLWQNRLIGFRNTNDPAHRVKFFSERFLDDFNLSHNKKEYAFHPILIDCLNIEAVGETPPLAHESESAV